MREVQPRDPPDELETVKTGYRVLKPVTHLEAYPFSIKQPRKLLIKLQV